MLSRVIPVIWTVCKALAFTLQLVGVTGVLAFILIGTWEVAGCIDQM